MGIRESRFSTLPFEEACRRVDPKDMQRIKASFKKVSSNVGLMSKNTFIGEVIGDIVPYRIAEQFFFACGGTNKGITFKDVLTGLVVITRSTMEEKEKFIFNMISKDGIIVSMDDLENFQILCGQNDHSDTSRFFSEVNILMSEQEFYLWLRRHKGFTPVTKWLLIEQMSRNSVNFSSIDDPQSFIQTLAQITNLTEDEIVTLEKRYGMMRASSKCGQLDIETLKHHTKSFTTAEVCEGLFVALDTDNDGFIDFKELVCGIAECCRGSMNERISFCFKVFDKDRDSSLSKPEVTSLVNALYSNKKCGDTEVLEVEVHTVVEEIIGCGDGSFVSHSEFVSWGTTSKDIDNLCNYLSQICHILFALRPLTSKQEGTIIRKWLHIQDKQGLQQSQIYYLIAMPWWTSWKNYVFYERERNSKESTAMTHAAEVNQYLRTTERTGRSPARNSIGNGIRRSHTTVAPLTVSTSLPISNGKAVLMHGNQAPGPVDNSSLIVPDTKKLQNLTAEGGSLKQNTILVRGRDFEIVPEPVWHALFTWYGANTPLPRTVIVPSEYDTEPIIELYPLQLLFYRHRAPMSRLPHLSLPSLGLSNFPNLHNNTHAQSNKQNTPGAQSTTVVIPKKTPMYRAAFSRKNTLKQVHHYLCQRLNLKIEDVRLWDMNHEGQSLLLEEEDKTLEDLDITTGRSLLIEVRNHDLSWPEEMNSLVASKNFRERSNTGPLVSGATGLHNLGNTCFMNSAVQCISNIYPLRQYFVLQRHLYELNKENPLGLKGTLAKRYGELMEDLWSGIFRSIAPVKLRWTIGKYAPRFIGFAQHDSQELLSFLLDGLHEDLNRVHDKPYVELKDSEGRSDKVVADEAWESHLKRNQSVVVDLFHGQLKSQVRCLACTNCSVRFDPYTFLSLPLPMENSLHVEIVVFLASKTVPTKFALLLSSDCKVQKMRQQLSELSAIPVSNLVIAEIAAATIVNFPKDSQKLRNVSSGHLVAYEIPFTSLPTLNVTANKSSSSSAHPNVDVVDTPQPSPQPGSTRTTSCSSSTSSRETLLHVASRPCEETPVENKGRTGKEQMDAVDSRGVRGPVREVASEAKEVIEQQCSLGYVILMHRKMIYKDFYFLSWQRFLPLLFGSPLLIACPEGSLNKDIYTSVWSQVCRLVYKGKNGDKETNVFPFTLTWTDKNGHFCSLCPWFRFCRGCIVPNDDSPFERKGTYLSIDWDHKTLHLYYQPSQERAVQEDSSVSKSWSLLHEPIDLDQCLKDFTKEEELGQDETWFCPKCKKQQSIAKKIDLWSLPPILVIHLKRFQQLNNRWVKSNKIVKFPMVQFDPSKYLVETRRDDYRNSRSISLRHFKKDSASSNSRENTGSAMMGESTEIENLVIDLDNGDEYKDSNSPEGSQHSLQSRPSINEQYDQLYNLCALSCHTGMLNGGHYISYAKNPNGKWYCYNDSTCKEVDAEVVESECPYMLFYQRNGLDYRRYLPDVTNKRPVVDEDDSKEFETDVKRICVIQ